ncbi:MAG TPA: hypothetical protein VMM79_19090 [Longimicrobiales bacterium]|nr:hypothetical protein [Longimicrobiales bacterium]
MQVERPRPAVFRVTLSAWEMATLIAAARWALEGGTGELDPGARDQLARVLASYDEATSRAGQD